MTKKVEYRVRPITRYIVTRFEEVAGDAVSPSAMCGSSAHGTFENGETAYQVAYALCRKEHDDSGQPVDSVNFIYPAIPDGVSVAPSSL